MVCSSEPFGVECTPNRGLRCVLSSPECSICWSRPLRVDDDSVALLVDDLNRVDILPRRDDLDQVLHVPSAGESGFSLVNQRIVVRLPIVLSTAFLLLPPDPDCVQEPAAAGDPR